jgi:hypothetical protein
VGAQPVELLADVRARRDEHRLLMKAVRIERGLAVEDLRDLRFEPRADRFGPAGGRRVGLVNEALDGVEVLAQHGGERLALAQAGRFKRLDEAARRRPQRVREGSVVSGIRRLLVDFDDPAHGQQPSMDAGCTPAGTWSVAITDTSDCSTSRLIRTFGVMATRETERLSWPWPRLKA